MNNSVNLIISGNLTGFSRFFTSADANVIYDEAKFLGVCVDEGRLSLDDMHQVLIDECDMDIYKEMV